jgi:hypothetical protein
MMPDFDGMTTAEIKHYISEHRNDEQEFRSALKVLMSRSAAPKHPYPFDLANPEVEVTALLKQIIDRSNPKTTPIFHHDRISSI